MMGLSLPIVKQEANFIISLKHSRSQGVGMRNTLNVHEASHTYLVCRCKEPLVSIRCPANAIGKFSKNFTPHEALSEMMASVFLLGDAL
jgi:hypothetical protein